MKTKILITAVLVAVFSTFSMAQPLISETSKCNFDVQLTSKNLILVRYQNADNDKIRIKVYNQNNDIIKSKSVTTSGNIKVHFDLSKLPEGNYYFKVFCNKEELCTEVVTKLANNKLGIPERLNGTKITSTEMFFTDK